MKEQKRLIWISLCVALVALLLSLKIQSLPEQDKWTQYFSSLLVGLVASAFLSMLMAISSYNIRRAETLEGFVRQFKEITKLLDKIDEKFDERRIDEIRTTIYEIASYDDWDFGEYFSKIHFFFHNHKNRKTIGECFYKPLNDMLIACRHCKRQIEKHGVGEKAFAEKLLESFYDFYEHNGIMCKDRKTIKIREKFNVWYWPLMYGKRQSKNL